MKIPGDFIFTRGASRVSCDVFILLARPFASVGSMQAKCRLHEKAVCFKRLPREQSLHYHNSRLYGPGV